MGSKSDETLLLEARSGARSIAFVANAASSIALMSVFFGVVRKKGLTPIYYKMTRHLQPCSSYTNTLDAEFRKDIYSASTVIFHFVCTEHGDNAEDCWGFSELEDLYQRGIPAIIYLSNGFSVQTVRKLGYAGKFSYISTSRNFQNALLRDLDDLAARRDETSLDIVRRRSCRPTDINISR
jgi:hypothetical protein